MRVERWRLRQRVLRGAMRFRSGSSAGVDQTDAPEGPQSCVPALLFLVRRAVSGIVNVFQTWRPVAASSATMLPRNVQHS